MTANILLLLFSWTILEGYDGMETFHASERASMGGKQFKGDHRRLRGKWWLSG